MPAGEVERFVVGQVKAVGQNPAVLEGTLRRISDGNVEKAPGLTVTARVHFGRGRRGALRLQQGEAPPAPPAPAGRVPRLARLMALAIRFDGLLRRGEVRDYAHLARLGHVTRARVTQVMNLLMLAPDIQEAILFLPVVDRGRDPLKEWQVRPVAAEPAWNKQRRMWRRRMWRSEEER